MKIGDTVFSKELDDNGTILSIETNDTSLVDDISELENGFESKLTNHETFEEVIADCLNKIIK